jgi:hypothetical protein
MQIPFQFYITLYTLLKDMSKVISNIERLHGEKNPDLLQCVSPKFYWRG